MWGALRDEAPARADPPPTIDRILDHLASLHTLKIPASVERSGGASTRTGRRSYLADCLKSSPAILLERHGHLIDDTSLRVFDHLRGDYEVDFWMARLTENRTPTKEQTAKQKSLTRLRRLARLGKLTKDGYFTEHAVCLREPVLWNTYVGETSTSQMTDPQITNDTDRAHSVSLGILAREDQRDAKKAVAAARKYDDKDADAVDTKGKSPAWTHESERDQRVVSLIRTVKERFLDGDEPDAECGKIDTDASLDHTFANEETHDAEEAYFAED